MKRKIPLKLIVGAVSYEKGISEEVVFRAVEVALVSAAKKKYGSDIDIRVHVDRETGSYSTYRFWNVVSNYFLEFPFLQLKLKEAKLIDKFVKVGDFVKKPLDSVEFGRISAQAAKHVIIQKVREEEKSLVIKNFINKKGTLLNNCVVKKINRDFIVLDCGGNIEGILNKSDTIFRDSYYINDKVKACIKDVIVDLQNPRLLLSRTCDQMLVELFKIEVPEINEGIIEIKSITRDPGIRAKIAVKSNDGRIDPQGACIGLKGTRVQAVSNELCGERIDVVLWSADPVQFVTNALYPVEISSIVVDEDTESIEVAIKEDFLFQVIGKNGHNIKLISNLINWKISVVTDIEAKKKHEHEIQKISDMFVEKLKVNKDFAFKLVNEGFSSIEEIAYLPFDEMLKIDFFSKNDIIELKMKAKTSLIEIENNFFKKDISFSDLLSLDNINKELNLILVNKNVINKDDLAELSVDDLIIISGMEKELSTNLILEARSFWFKKFNS